MSQIYATKSRLNPKQIYDILAITARVYHPKTSLYESGYDRRFEFCETIMKKNILTCNVSNCHCNIEMLSIILITFDYNQMLQHHISILTYEIV